jgi:hypothetical protein
MKRLESGNKPLSIEGLAKRLTRIGAHALMREVKGFGRPESDAKLGRGPGVFANALRALTRWAAGLRSLSELSVRLTKGPFRRIVMKALALKPRGFVPRDVLVLSKLSAHLQVEWRARDIHPWDRDQPSSRQAELFREQALHDTADAVVRLFQILPEMDALDIRVLGPGTFGEKLMFAGTVSRSEAFAARSLSSSGMRLMVMGVRYQVRNGHLEPLE